MSKSHNYIKNQSFLIQLRISISPPVFRVTNSENSLCKLSICSFTTQIIIFY